MKTMAITTSVPCSDQLRLAAVPLADCVECPDVYHDLLYRKLENSVEFPQKKLKIELPYDSAIALLGIYPRDTGVLMHREIGRASCRERVCQYV